MDLLNVFEIVLDRSYLIIYKYISFAKWRCDDTSWVFGDTYLYQKY